ncbi:hypothetical protein EV175_003932 [Coemansia sp. RSA 1933]|nr:hypothetical protein EV175_003932 [Coemansia sp. RSA 1933]
METYMMVDSSALSFGNVGIAGVMLVINVAVSVWLNLGLTRGLIVASIRCVVQLTLLSMVLNRVFMTQSPVYIFGLALGMGVLASVEVTFWRAKNRFPRMLLGTFLSLIVSVLAVALFGNVYSLGMSPAYTAEKFIPTVGMLFGNCVIGVSIGMSAVMDALETHRDRIEVMMCYGASRWELIRLVAVDAMKAAMLPSITNMSITGLISIPGMMTGWVLSGGNVLDAAHYQQIIFFMLTASSAISALLCVGFCASVLIDKTPVLRLNRITTVNGKADKKRPQPMVSRNSTRTRLVSTFASRTMLRRRP